MKRLLILSLLLVGCGESKKERISLNDLCKNTPAICEDLNDWKKDDKCKDERVELIYVRKDELNMPSDKNRFILIQHFEKYAQCIELAAGIEHKKYIEKRSYRIQGLITAYDELERLKEVTKQSDLPELLYWHGVRHQNKKLLKQYLDKKNNKEYNTVEHQIRLGFYYSKFNHKEAIKYYENALKLSRKNDNYDPILFLGLSHNYNNLRKYSEGYYWAYLCKLLGLVTMNDSDIYKEKKEYSSIDFSNIEEKAIQDYENIYKEKVPKLGIAL